MVIMQNSEYRRHYVPKFDSYRDVYSANVGYRSARRSREFAHNRDVFTWEPEQWEKKSCSSLLQQDVRDGVNPSAQYKHALHNKEYQEKQLSQCLQEQCKINGNTPETGKAQEPRTPPPSPQNESEDPLNVDKKVVTGAEGAKQVNGHKGPTKSTKPKKPRTGPAVVISKKTNIRPKSCQAGPATAKAVTLRPPFVMFGSRDREPTISVKRTHNVKSPTDVYASALRASKWRDDQKAKRPKSAPLSAGKRPVLFDVMMDKETSCWQTEYGGHFVQYKPTEYERNAKSQMSVRRCTDI